MTTSTMKLVCVTPYVPYRGIDHAGGEYLRRYLRAAVAAGWKVRLLAPSTAANRDALARADPVIEAALWPEPESLPGRARNVLVTGVPATTGSRWLRLLPDPAPAWLAEATVIDLQWADSLWDAPAVRGRFPGRVVVGLAHDVRTESIRRALRRGSGRARGEALLAIARVSRQERDALNACHRVFVFKREDGSTLRALGVTSDIAVAPVPLPPSSLPAPDPGARRVLCTGAFFRPENVEGALWLLDEVMPRVRRLVPGVVVRLAGSRPPRQLIARACSDVEVTGYLPSMREAYVGVTCVAVPLRRGAGVKFKSVEAVAAGFPLVTTSVGAEGVDDVTGTAPDRVHDDPEGFARELAAVLLDPGAALVRAEAARDVAHRVPAFDGRVADLLAACRDLT